VIKSNDDILFLANLYANVPGELELFDMNDKVLCKVEWTDNPFVELADKHSVTSECYVVVRLLGPKTILAVSLIVEKLDSEAFQHEKKELLMKWARFIDDKVKNEMGRKNDLCMIFRSPKEKLATMSELMLAIKLSKYATHAIPTETGFIVTNPKSTYLSSVELNDDGEYCTSLQLDKDDGFNSAFGGDCDFLNDSFKLWKNNAYQGNLSDYYPQY
jgi:hypothetical protein